jgi:hypothetical protein
MKNQTGLTFSIPTKNGETFYGRIIFDTLYFAQNQLLHNPQSHLTVQNSSLLIEVYIYDVNGQKQILLPGVLTSPQRLEKGIWKTEVHESVDLKQLDFPEFISIRNPQTARFHKGEVEIDFNIDEQLLTSLKLFPGNVPAINIVDMAYFAQGETEKIDKIFGGKFDALDLANYDLRFAPFRDEIYSLIDEDPNGSYKDLSQKQCVDIERFAAYL